MATGRTVQKHYRLYVDGYDLSGFSRSIGPFGLEYDESELTTWTDSTKGYLPNHCHISLGTYNAVFDNTATTGIHALLGTAGIKRTALIAMGIRGAPAAGDPCFGGQFTHGGYQPLDDSGALTVTIPWQGWASDATTLLFASPFGQLLHASGAETAANTAIGYDNPTELNTTKGGYMVYQVLTSSLATHTATLSIDDCDEAAANLNANFAPLSGATTGVITVKAGVSGIVALAPTATVRRYLRWQILLGTATSVTFALAFMRG